MNHPGLQNFNEPTCTSVGKSSQSGFAGQIFIQANLYRYFPVMQKGGYIDTEMVQSLWCL